MTDLDRSHLELHVPDEPERRAKMRSLSCALQLAVILALALVGLWLVRQSASEAAPRNAPAGSAQSGVPLGVSADRKPEAVADDGPSGTPPPAGLSGLSIVPDASMPAPLDAVTRSGIATHMGDSPYAGPRYLALPMGPGYWVNICGPALCDDVLSTDAGPERWLQKPPHNRIADLSVELFVKLCGCPASRGIFNVSWTVLKRPNVTIPPTDP